MGAQARHRSSAREARDNGGVREYVERMSRVAADECEDLELAAQCAHEASDDEAELHFRMRAFRAAPSFGALRRLADALSRTQHLEMAAEAWRYLARACPRDAQACAAAQHAAERLTEREAGADMQLPAFECGTPAHSGSGENGRPSGVYRSQDASTQENDPKSRKHL